MKSPTTTTVGSYPQPIMATAALTSTGGNVGLVNVTQPPMPPVTSIAATSTVTTVTTSTTSTSSERTPLTESRVGWIYDLSKQALIREMSKYNLDTSGRAQELRSRFVDYWRSQVSDPTRRPTRINMLEASAFEDTREATGQGDALRGLTDELRSVREMLDLSPNTDSTTVKRTLASLLRSLGNTTIQERSLDSGLPTTHNVSAPATVVCGAQDYAMAVPWEQRGASSVPPPHFMSSGTAHGDFRLGYQPSLPLRSDDATRFDRAGNQPGGMARALTHPPSTGSRIVGAMEHSRPLADCSALCNVVRKWNLRFDGRKDPVSFLERLEELMESYSVPRDNILLAMPELLHGPALLWFRNCRGLWDSYDSFRRSFETQFFPPGYRRNLDEEIRKRTQGDHEPFRDFVIAITTLIRRSGNFSEQAKLDLVYANMRPDYKLLVRRSEFYTLERMIELAEEYEAYLREKSSFRSPPPPSVALVPETAYYHKKRADRPLDSAVVEDKHVQESQMHEDAGRIGSLRSPAPTNKVAKDGRKFRVVSKPPNSKPFRARTPPNREPTRSSPRREGKPASRVQCWRCLEEGHIARGCQNPRVVNCFYCHTPGVTADQCQCEGRGSGNESPAQKSGGRLSLGSRNRERPPRSGQDGSGR